MEQIASNDFFRLSVVVNILPSPSLETTKDQTTSFFSVPGCNGEKCSFSLITLDWGVPPWCQVICLLRSLFFFFVYKMSNGTFSSINFHGYCIFFPLYILDILYPQDGA